MKFELTKEFISDLSDAAASGNSTFISSSLVDLHPADIAEILEEFDYEFNEVEEFLKDFSQIPPETDDEDSKNPYSE